MWHYTTPDHTFTSAHLSIYLSIYLSIHLSIYHLLYRLFKNTTKENVIKAHHNIKYLLQLVPTNEPLT